MLEVFLCL